MTSRRPRERSQWRASVQGVRALAVALVVVHHFFPDLLPGGYVGVDVFFVVSGYLVLGSLFETMANGDRIRWLDFYYRRAKRILPAAAVTVLITLLLYAFVLDPLFADRYAGDALASLAFVANFRMRVESGGYFSVFDPSPFRHFWTLGVEEQFYLALPIAALAISPLAARWGRTGLLLLVASVAGCLFVASTLVALTHPSAAFFMLPTRGWEFLVGGSAALLPVLRQRWATMIGIVGIVLSTVMLSPESLVPGPWLLPAVMGTGLILASADLDPASRSLGARPLRWLGDRSYAVYLAHWPIAAWLFLSTSGENSSPARHSLGAVIAVVAGHIVYQLVEAPLHHGRLARRGPRAVLPLTGAVVAVSLAATVIVPGTVDLTTERRIPRLTVEQVLNGPLPQEAVVPVNVEPGLQDARGLNGLYDGCHEQFGGTVPTPCVFGGSWQEADVVVMGDSHAAHWFDAVRDAVGPGVTTAFLTHTSCPMFDAGAAEPASCTPWRDGALADIRAAAPRVILLSNFTTGYGSTEAAVEQGWGASLAALGAQRVVVLGDVPTPPEDVARCLARNVDNARRCAFAPSGDQRHLDLAERAAVEAAGATWVDTWDWLCAHTCSTLAGNTMLWRDAQGHLTPEGSALLAPRLREALEASGS